MTDVVAKTNGDAASRFDELRAKRAELAAAREARDLQRTAEEQLAAEEQGLADDEAIDKAALEHGPVGKMLAVVKTDLGAIILKRAHPATFKRFQDTGSTKHDELEKLVRPSVVHPTMTRFDQIMAALPATMLRCANAVSVLAGVRMEDVTAK